SYTTTSHSDLRNFLTLSCLFHYLSLSRSMYLLLRFFFFFFFNATATTEIYTLSLHDALPILSRPSPRHRRYPESRLPEDIRARQDLKSTRLNSSHSQISYAVFCLKKNNNQPTNNSTAPTKYRTSPKCPLPLDLDVIRFAATPV